MRYSLVSRVRGTFLGAFLGGEILGVPNGCNLGETAVLGSESLIALGKLDVDDWLKRHQQASVDIHTNNTSSGKIIISTLPVTLFFHENKLKLRENLLQVLQIWENDPVTRDTTLALGYAIAQSLTEKFHPLTLIPQTISFLGETETSIPHQLLKVNTLLQEQARLEKVQSELSKQEKLSNNIALAFYCFLSTLEDFRLTVLRANQNNSQEDFTSIIAGALSGSHNSTSGIPINWQILSSQTNSVWGLKSFSQMLELADALMAVWSGAYNPDSNPLIEEQTTIFAAPRVIRPR